MTATTLTFDLYLRATPDQVWEALTDPGVVPRWRFGLSFQTSWRPAARIPRPPLMRPDHGQPETSTPTVGLGG
jgi:uncharacterized protein YndB with AHSA1/START domain